VLQQVQIQGQYLKVGRPKNSTGMIPTPAQLKCGNPNFVPQNTKAKKSTSAGIVQQALRQGNVIKGDPADGNGVNCRIKVMNFPIDHDEAMIRSICEIFGKLVSIEMVRNNDGSFTGVVNAEFESELEARKALSGITGFTISDQVLDARKITI
jgi:hypothetical protein